MKTADNNDMNNVLLCLAINISYHCNAAIVNLIRESEGCVVAAFKIDPTDGPSDHLIFLRVCYFGIF